MSCVSFCVISMQMVVRISTEGGGQKPGVSALHRGVGAGPSTR